jgi:uncharacterized membrane protein YebE (DUF533 family)
MTNRGLVGWLKNRVHDFVDPERQERTDKLSLRLHKRISEQRHEFNLETAAERLNIDEADRDEVCRKVYVRCVDQAWKDLELTDKELRSLEWMAQVLRLDPTGVADCHRLKGRAIFETLLSRALEDGHIDKAESQRLDACARWMGTTTGSLVREFFLEEGTGFLRALFLDATRDGRLIESEWKEILQQTSRLGISSDELEAALGHHAAAAIEHAFANAAADGRLTPHEDAGIRWMLSVLPVDRPQRTYVERQMRELRILTEAAEGRLPSLAAPATVELRSGEIVHYFGSVSWFSERVRQGARHVDRVDGYATITDSRLIFSSPTKSFVVSHKSVLEMQPHLNGLELRSATKGTGVYDFDDANRMASAIYRVAVKRWNQTIVEKSEGLPNRHISRDIRQRVWQTYGGRCAECGASDYIEYDHIIPVAKGGSSTEKNVQLLCRRCNLKKLDHI